MIKKIAIFGFALALLSILAFFAGVICFRTGALAFGPAFSFVKIAIPASFAATAISIGVTLWILFRPVKAGLAYALVGVMLGLSLSVPMLRLKGTVDSLPRIHDITTDTEKPPQFVAILPLRKDALNSAVYEGHLIAEQQHKAYPDISPKILAMAPTEAFQLLVAKARAQPWEVVSIDKEAMRIEATATSALFAFKDDLVIQVSIDAKGSRVDMRSVSRVGISDLGKNAERIRNFFATVSE